MFTEQGYTLQFGTNVGAPPLSPLLSPLLRLLDHHTVQYHRTLLLQCAPSLILPTKPQTLGHQRLISLLLPLLLTASSTSSSLPRVIATSSAGHATAPPRGFNPKSVVRDPSLPPAQKEDPPKKGAREYPKWVEYGQSKWGNIAVGRYLHWMYGPDEGRAKEEAKAEREGKGEIISIVVHPGGFGFAL